MRAKYSPSDCCGLGWHSSAKSIDDHGASSLFWVVRVLCKVDFVPFYVATDGFYIFVNYELLNNILSRRPTESRHLGIWAELSLRRLHQAGWSGHEDPHLPQRIATMVVGSETRALLIQLVVSAAWTVLETVRLWCCGSWEWHFFALWNERVLLRSVTYGWLFFTTSIIFHCWQCLETWTLQGR